MFIKNKKNKLSCSECTSTFLYTSVKTGKTACLKCGHGRIEYNEKNNIESKSMLQKKIDMIFGYLEKSVGARSNYHLITFRRCIMLSLGVTSNRSITNWMHVLADCGYITSTSADTINLKQRAILSYFPNLSEMSEKSKIEDELAEIDKYQTNVSG